MSNIKIKDMGPAFLWLSKERGKTKKEIATFFGISRNTVADALKRYEEQGHFGNRKGQGRPKTSTTEAKQEEMEAALKEDSHTRTHSTRKLARRLKISRTSVRRMLKKGGYFPWKDQERQLLTEAAKKKRRERCPRLLERFADGDHRQVLFTDEKLFTIEQAHNRQNDRRWHRGPPSVASRVVARAVKPKSVMVWAGVGHGLKTPLIFIPQGVKINADCYIKMLEDELLPWLEENADAIVFQQDGAPSHTAKKTQEWCDENFADFITKLEWPPSSPDLNMMDYSIWSILESTACAEVHTSIESLINALRRAWDGISQDVIDRAVDQFPRRLQACIDAEGGHFE